MKKLILFLVTIPLSLIAFSQADTTIKCFPIPVVKKIAIDLVKCDSIKAELVLTNDLVRELKTSITLRDNLISTMEVKEKNYLSIIDFSDKKYKLLEDANKELQQKLLREKLKLRRSTWVSIGVGVLTSLTYLIIK